VLLVAVLAACHADHASLENITGPYTWGGVSNVTHLSHLYFSGQPDQAALEEARRNGVVAVINLRDPSEYDWDEKAAVEALGMTYYNVPVAGDRPFERSGFERIEALVKQHHDEQVLVHCTSSNRAGAWLATHMVEEHGTDLEESLEIGRRTGMTKSSMETAVREYLGPDS